MAVHRTIDDFGAQFQRYRTGHNKGGFYGSVEGGLLDTFGPLLTLDELKGLSVAEIGAGPGRFINILLDAGVGHAVAVEPSEAFAVLRENTAARADRVTYVNAPGEQLPLGNFDAVFSIGVLMSIPDVDPVVQRAHAALREGGTFYAWLYGREGNELYLAFVGPLRRLTTRLPDPIVAGISHTLNVFLGAYIALCRWVPFPWPLRAHMVNAMAKYTRWQRFLVIFDQLNPEYAKYYTRAEVEDLFKRNGFTNITLYHRHGYSWSVKATKGPAGGAG